MTGAEPQWLVCPCNTISDFPQQCPYHSPSAIKTIWGSGYTTTTLAPIVYRLSDDDVERIAKRVAELVKPKRKRKA